MRRHDPREPARRDAYGLSSQFPPEPGRHPIHQRSRPIDDPRLHRRHSVRADGPGRGGQRNARKLRRPGRQGVEAYLDSGRIAPPL